MFVSISFGESEQVVTTSISPVPLTLYHTPLPILGAKLQFRPVATEAPLLVPMLAIPNSRSIASLQRLFGGAVNYENGINEICT